MLCTPCYGNPEKIKKYPAKLKYKCVMCPGIGNAVIFNGSLFCNLCNYRFNRFRLIDQLNPIYCQNKPFDLCNLQRSHIHVGNHNNVTLFFSGIIVNKGRKLNENVFSALMVLLKKNKNWIVIFKRR